jgi:ubiquinone biosynthesis protein
MAQPKMSNTTLYSGVRRVRRAYRTAAAVMLSYALLLLGKKLFGARYYEKRILALHLRNAERVKTAILELNGLFIKIGQMLSILSNFLPESFQKPLEALQDKIPPRPYEQVKARIERELGKPPEMLFERFDPRPLAAASIGQAHRARLHDGTEVVVKVQHADIEAIAKIDLDIVRRLTRLIAWFFDIKGMDFLYTQLRKMIEEELDFAQEARAMRQIAENLRGEQGLVVPEPHPAFSTARVLTTTWHEGVKISDAEQLEAWNLNKRDLAARLLRAYCGMVFRDGFYHADPHPGNILVKADGTLVLLDFGATGQLGPALREGIPRLIESALKNDTTGMIDACRAMGFIAEGREAEQVAEKMIAAMRNFLQNEVQFEGLNFKDIKVNPFNNSLFDLIRDIGFGGISGTVQMPKDYVLLNRMMTLLLGLSNSLDPAFNPLDVVRPYAKDLVMGRRGDLISYARKLLQETALNAISLPDELRQTLQDARRGRLGLRSADARDGARLLYLALQQGILAFLGLAALGLGIWFSRTGEHVPARCAYAGAAFAGYLLFRAWRTGGRLWRRMGD